MSENAAADAVYQERDQLVAALSKQAMPELPDLNPDGPHSPEHTAEVAGLFDDCSRFLTYATMGSATGLDNPADAYRLIAELYSATGRLPQVCEQIDQFLRTQAATGRLREAQGRDIGQRVRMAADSLRLAGNFASSLTTALQNAQTAINGLGVKDGDDA